MIKYILLIACAILFCFGFCVLYFSQYDRCWNNCSKAVLYSSMRDEWKSDYVDQYCKSFCERECK